MKNPKHHLVQRLGALANDDIHFEGGHIQLVEETPPQKQKNMVRHFAGLVLLPTLALLIIGWLTASVYLQKVRLGDSLISTHQSDSTLQDTIQRQAAGYKVMLSYPDGTQKQFSIRDVGLSIDAAKSVQNIRDQQHQLANRIRWTRPLQAYLAVTANGPQLNSFIAQQATVTVQPATDATLSIDHGQVKVSDGTTGSHNGLVEPVDTILNAVSRLQPTPLKLQKLSTRPAITSQQLASSQAKLQKILSQQITFTLDNKTVQPSSEDIADWVELSAKDGGRSVDITINSGKVLSYINKITADSVHPPKSQIEVVQDDGTRKVLIPGINGTDVLDKSAAATKVADSVLKGQGLQQTLTVQYAPFKTVTAQAYDKWIEVDITNKRMYAYEKSTLVKTFLITAGAPATPTVTGQYAIYAKYTQQDMRGQNVDGSSYFQPKVPWVNYFYADYAIHGNYWRPLSYFGNINSSHGCVGIVESDAQWTYTWAPIGTPVIVHT